jgi:TetR/AcrR family transcriptional regulator, fatty acid metabolism regulator protein
MEKKITARDKQALATKKRIYNCGFRLMNRYGYANITVAQVAKKANVSIGTFYHHFRSKFDLLVEVYRLGDVFFNERVAEILRRYESCPERVTAYLSLYAQLSIRNGIEMVRSLYVPTNEMFVSGGRAMQELLTDILRTGQQRGEITDSVPPEVITEKLFVVARGVIFDWCLHNGKNDLVEEMRDIIGRQTQSYYAEPVE